MKKIVIPICFFFVFIVTSLYITTRISNAHAIARNNILTSTEIVKSIGVVQHVYLFMFSEKTGPAGKGCATLLYFVTGVGDKEWVRVRLLNEGYRSEWRVVELMEGLRGDHKINCVYG